MLDSKVWPVERPNMWTFYIFEPLKTDTYEPNISLIRLILIMQNPEYIVAKLYYFPIEIIYGIIFQIT